MIEPTPEEQQDSPVFIPESLSSNLNLSALQGISLQDLEHPQGLLDKSVPYAAAVTMSLDALAEIIATGAPKESSLSDESPLQVQFAETLKQLDTLCNWIEFLQEQDKTTLPAGSSRIPAQVQLLRDMYDAIETHDGKVPALLVPMLYDDVTNLSTALHTYVEKLGGVNTFSTSEVSLPVDAAGLSMFVQQAQSKLEQLQNTCTKFLQDTSSDKNYQERIEKLRETLEESQSFLSDVLSIVASASPENESALYDNLQKRMQSFFVSASVATDTEGPEVEVISKRRLRMLMPVLEKAAFYLEKKERELGNQLLQ